MCSEYLIIVGHLTMETILILIVGILVAVAIYQGIQIKKLRRQTIQAFLKVCEKAFKKGDDKKC